MASALALLPPSLRTNPQAQQLALETDAAKKSASEARRKVAEMPLVISGEMLVVGSGSAFAAGYADGRWRDGIMGIETSLPFAAGALIFGLATDMPELVQAGASRVFVEAYKQGLKAAGFKLEIVALPKPS